MASKKTVLEKALVIWGKKLQKEAVKAKSTVRSDFEVVVAEDVTLQTRASEVLSSIFLGGGDLTVIAVIVARLRFSDFDHWYFLPSAKTTQLPGEHHALLPGSVPRSCLQLAEKGQQGPVTWSSDDPKFSRTLGEDRALMKLSKKVNFSWRGQGVTTNHQFPLQLRPGGNGWVHVAMKGGGYGFGMDKAGFKCFTRICQALQPLLDSKRDEPGMDFLSPFDYSAVVSADREPDQE
jgi:hypothetical protein